MIFKRILGSFNRKLAEMKVKRVCVALPGKVIETDGFLGKVDFQGNIVNVTLGVVDAQVGDYVLVHAGCAIEVMQKDQAQEILDLFAELETMDYGS
jgi:hydrogenase expression/formation protein HypC